MLAIASQMIQRGYPATFITGEEFAGQIKKIGAECIATPPFNPEMWEERETVPPGVPRFMYDMKTLFAGVTAERWEILKNALLKLHEKDPDGEIVIVVETFFMGANPLSMGAPLPKCFTKRPKVICIHAVPYMATSIDTAPFGLGLPPDSSPAGQARNKALAEKVLNEGWLDIIAYEREIMASLGATQWKPAHPFDNWMTGHDITLQMCPPSLEYPRSDLHPKVRFVGALPALPIEKDYMLPSWWGEVTRGDRRVVTVTQGTVAIDYNNLMIPTIRALGNRPDLLIIAILGAKSATLPPEVSIPSNTRVIDYLSYDAILPYSDVFVINAGYGGFIHGVVNGVPMVLSGVSEDKPETSMRGEYAGVGINLKTGRPESEQVSKAVDRILEDGAFKDRVMEIKRENEEMNAVDMIERYVLEFAA